MPAHTAKSLFDLNIESAESCMELYEGIAKLGSSLEISWLLRSAVVFSVAALDAYFHDKIRYRAGRFVGCMPNVLKEFKIKLGGLAAWDGAKRKGNVLRNWLTEHFSARPLQKKEDIARALKLVGIDDLWATIEPDTPERDKLLGDLGKFVGRRNRIVHEGDRQASRSSGKKLRDMSPDYAKECLGFAKGIVAMVEARFPR